MTYDKAFLTQIIDILIPEGRNGEPPGSESRAADYIAEYIDSKREYFKEITDILDDLSSLKFINEAGLKKHEQRSPLEFQRLVELVYTSYYGDPAIVEKRGLPKPPQPGGHDMKSFDMRLIRTDIF